MRPLMAKGAWRDNSAHAPQHRFDVALTDAFTDPIEKALLDLVETLPIEKVISHAGEALTKKVDPIAKAAIVAQVLSELNIGPAALGPISKLLELLVAEGFTTGVHAAAEQLDAHAITVGNDLLPEITVDWDRWKPGDTIALGEVAAGALRANLDELGITVKGIADTVLDTIGNRIGDGLLAGDGVDTIARAIRDDVGSRSRAERIAHTEIARAQTNASMLVYSESGVTEYELLLADDACPECEEIAAGNPYALGDDTGRVPIHPFCRCADAPVASSINSSRINSVDVTGEES